MNVSDNISSTPPAAGDDDHFDPSDAADLLVSTRRKARRGFEQTTPLGYLFAAVVVGAAYGALWLSVRHQDPYVGPSLAVIGWVYGIDALLADACVVVSCLIQRGADPRKLSASMGRLGNAEPASVIGAVVDLVAAASAARHQSTGEASA